MKKLIYLAVAIMLVFSGCGKNGNIDKSDNGVIDEKMDSGKNNSAENAAKNAGDSMENAADNIGDGAKNLVDGATNAVDDAVGGVKNAVDSVTGNNNMK